MTLARTAVERVVLGIAGVVVARLRIDALFRAAVGGVPIPIARAVAAAALPRAAQVVVLVAHPVVAGAALALHAAAVEAIADFAGVTNAIPATAVHAGAD